MSQVPSYCGSLLPSPRLLIGLAMVGVSLLLTGCDEVPKKNEAEVRNEGPARPRPGNKAERSPRSPAVDLIWQQSGRSNAAVASLSDEKLVELLKNLSDRRGTEQRQAFEVAIGELASRNPRAALGFFNPAEMEFDEPGFGFAMFMIAQVDPEAAKEWLRSELKKGSDQVQKYALMMSLQSLGQRDPAAALEFYAKGNWGRAGGSDSINAIFLEYGQRSPVEADAAAAGLLKGSELELARYNIALSAGMKDPSLALDIAAKMGKGDLRDMITNKTLAGLMKTDPADALRRLHAMDPSSMQGTLMVDATMDGSLVSSMGRQNPDALVSLLGKMVLSSGNQPLFSGVVMNLAVQHPDKVEAMLSSIPEGAAKNSLVRTQFEALARDNLDTAVERLGKMLEGASKVEGYRAVGAATNADLLEETAVKLGNLSEAEKNAFYTSAITSVAASDPRRAADLLAEGTVSLKDQQGKDMVSKVAMRLAGSNPEEAEIWMSRLPEERRPNAMYGIAREMARNDVAGLARRLSDMPRDQSWATGVKVLIENISGSDPEMAQSWRKELEKSGLK